MPLGMMVACDSMDDNYRQYLDEYSYSSKVTSVSCQIGYERVALRWNNPDDQKAKRILIEYGTDGQSKEFDTLVDYALIDGLDAGIGYEFSVYTLDNADNRSVPAKITAMPISKSMVENLLPPTCVARTIDGVPAVYWTSLSSISMSFCRDSYLEYKVMADGESEIIKEGRFDNPDEGTSLNDYTLLMPVLESGSSYVVEYTVHVYPVYENSVTMDAVPVTGKSRITVK